MVQIIYRLHALHVTSNTFITKMQLEPRVRHGITAQPSLQCSNRPLNEQVHVNAWSLAQHVQFKC